VHSASRDVACVELLLACPLNRDEFDSGHDPTWHEQGDKRMSQPNVERAIGRLATDEAARRKFNVNPRAVVLEMAEWGMELTECERQSLASLDPHALARFARSIDARLQKSDLKGESS
jgi:hypothetical protein